jgi:hypothetical protein
MINRRKLITGALLGWVAIGLVAALPAFAYKPIKYKEAPVKNGGKIVGKVSMVGGVPEPRVFPLVLYPFGSYCKKISDGHGNVLLKEYNVDDKGGVQDAVIAVENVKSGKPFPVIKNDFIAVDCMFHPADVADSEMFEVHEGQMHHVHPLLEVMQNDQPLRVKNEDPIIHNGQVFQKEKGNIVLNFPLPVSDGKWYGGPVHFLPGKHIVQMICGMHEFMQTWGWIVENPYYAKTQKGGDFTIDELPPGTYEVVAWLPHMKPIEKKVTVDPNGTAVLNFEFDSTTVIRPHYESQKKFRVGPEAMEKENLEGCEGPFCVKREEKEHDHDTEKGE